MPWAGCVQTAYLVANLCHFRDASYPDLCVDASYPTGIHEDGGDTSWVPQLTLIIVVFVPFVVPFAVCGLVSDL